MSFPEIQGQTRAVDTLRGMLRGQRLHHALLFEGPEGVGKLLAARWLARAVLCLRTSPTASPPDACGSCESCRLMESGNHPDFLILDRALRRFHPDRAVRSRSGLFLTVDLVRYFVIEPAGRAPAVSPRRVFVINDAHRMNEEAQNALLKTLEEPPGDAMLMLVSAAADRLLATIRSRTQRVRFDLLPGEFVLAQLHGAGVPAQAAALLNEMAGGRVGPALRWARAGVPAVMEELRPAVSPSAWRNPESFATTITKLGKALAPELAAADTTGPEDAAESGDGEEPEEAARKAPREEVDTDTQREALRVILLGLATMLRPQMRDAAAALAASDGVHAIAECERMIDRNVNPQLALERLAAALCGEWPAAPAGLAG